MSDPWRDERLHPTDARWLMTASGRALLQAVREGLAAGEDSLRTAERLARDGVPASRRAAALEVATASREAEDAGHPAGSWWTSLALEQASAPMVAAWRAHRFAHQPAADVTAGCGGDAMALAAVTDDLAALERSPTRLPLLARNLRGRAVVLAADALQSAVRRDRWILADPDRRQAGRRLRRLRDVHPSVPSLREEYGGHPTLAIAASPALDLQDPALPDDAEVEFVQVDDRLVEATIWLGAARTVGDDGAPVRTTATLLPTGQQRQGAPGPAEPAGPLEALLVEPAPALVRARLHDRFAAEHRLHRVDPRRALLTGGNAPDSPWCRRWAIEAVVSARPKSVRQVLRTLDDRPLEIAVHGLEADPRLWLQQLGHPPTGPNGRRLHLIRTTDGAVAVVTIAA